MFARAFVVVARFSFVVSHGVGDVIVFVVVPVSVSVVVAARVLVPAIVPHCVIFVVCVASA